MRTRGAKLFVGSLSFVFFYSSFNTVLTINCVSFVSACRPKMFGNPCRKNNIVQLSTLLIKRIFLYSLINVPEMHCKFSSTVGPK